MRLRRVLWLCRGDRERVATAVCRRAGPDRSCEQADGHARSGRGAGGVILNASGCLDALTAPETARQLDAFVTKTVTPEPREGNAPVRIAETDAGMLNSIGLANPGRERFLDEVLPAARRSRRPDLGVGRRLLGRASTPRRARALDARGDVAASSSTSRARTSTRRPSRRRRSSPPAGRATRLPLFAKLSPAVPDVGAVAAAVEEAGADGALARQHDPRPRARPQARSRCSARRPAATRALR